MSDRDLSEDRRSHDATEGADADRDAIDAAHRRYREADCEIRSKDIEVAEVNLTFNREWLASILDLREGDVATRQDVILAELDVEREEKRLAWGKQRAAACRRELGIGEE